MAHLRLHGVHVENLAWHEVIARYDRPHTFFYLDPPYWQTEGYGVEFGFEQYRAHGRAGDHPDIRSAFDGLGMEQLSISYTVGGGQGVAAKELLVWNERCEEMRKVQTLELF